MAERGLGVSDAVAISLPLCPVRRPCNPEAPMTTTSGHVSVAKSIDDAKLGVVLWHRQDWSFRRCSARAAAAQWSRAARCDTDGFVLLRGRHRVDGPGARTRRVRSRRRQPRPQREALAATAAAAPSAGSGTSTTSMVTAAEPGSMLTAANSPDCCGRNGRQTGPSPTTNSTPPQHRSITRTSSMLLCTPIGTATD